MKRIKQDHFGARMNDTTSTPSQFYYERFCYAMAIIMDRVRVEQRGFFESSREALNKATTFEVYLSRAADEAFKLGARDFGLTDGMYEYCNKEQNYEYDEF